jgi:fibronectin type 3 domain-containing protein/uncharacterized membrane protein
MNRTHIHSHFAILVLLVSSLLAARASAQSSYSPTDIVVPGGDSFRADAMNDLGEVVGGYTPAGGPILPVVWRNGVFTNLPLLPGTVFGWARGINNTGQMVGACGTQACVWENGTVRALASVAGTTESAAWAINDAGTIVGHVYTPLQINGPFREAVIWKGSTVAKLVPPTAGARTWAWAIDSTGRVAVSWTTGNEFFGEWHPSRWTPNVSNGTTGTMTTLGNWGFSSDINDSGVVSGYMGAYAYLWDGTTPTELGNLYWGNDRALSINNAGVAVGYNEEPDSYISRAWVAHGPGDLRDLNLLLTHSSTHAYPGSLVSTVSINSSGQILAVGTDTNGYWGSHVVLTPSSQPPGDQNPPPPSYVYAYSGDSVVDLYWPVAYFAESYHVKRSTVSGGPYTTIAANVIGNWFTDSSVENGTPYYYVVSSVKGSYESADSLEAAAQPLGVVPSAPASVLASAGNGVVNVNWSLADYATGYNVKRATVSGGPYTTIATDVTGLTFTDTTVINGTRYYYVVSSQSGTYESGDSTEVSVYPLATPVAPTNLTATQAKGGNSANLVWQQSTSAQIQFNRVYRSINGGAFTQIAQLSARTTFSDSKLNRKTTYNYKVTAINVNGQESAFSNTVIVRPK